MVLAACAADKVHVVTRKVHVVTRKALSERNPEVNSTREEAISDAANTSTGENAIASGQGEFAFSH